MVLPKLQCRCLRHGTNRLQHDLPPCRQPPRTVRKAHPSSVTAEHRRICTFCPRTQVRSETAKVLRWVLFSTDVRHLTSLRLYIVAPVLGAWLAIPACRCVRETECCCAPRAVS